ncbi:hypothetical protein CK203_037164 [Vitis vinifera]|uniref:RNase H type-1 domain-containing protein n=1 Tax=Vitis vinifera TaxID=29760 RepID=A0A438HS21_VITVI|nr:hypothetical protein CK203_037164 [Vitis vinifera]
MVSERGIEADPDKIKAILNMLALRTERVIRGFLGRLQYISRFIARLTNICLVSPTPGRPLLLYLSVSDVALGCMLVHLDDSGKEQAIYYLNHLASLPISDDRAIDDDFLDEDVAVVTSLSGWRMYFDSAANQSGYGISVLLISPHGDHIPRFSHLAFSDRHPTTNNIVEYETCILGIDTALELGIRQMEVFGDSNMVLRQIQATLASMIDIPTDATVHPLLIESRSTPTYCCLIDEAERSTDGMLLLCLDHASINGVMREVHAGVCGPHMGAHMLAYIIGKISLKSSSGHEFILVAIDYFTKWVEAASYVRLTSSRHHRSSAYKPQMNMVVEATNKNIKRILQRMVETSQDWSKKLLFVLWAYRTSFRTFIEATPYSLVYGMEAVLPVEIEMGSLRVALEQTLLH